MFQVVYSKCILAFFAITSVLLNFRFRCKAESRRFMFLNGGIKTNVSKILSKHLFFKGHYFSLAEFSFSTQY